MIIEKYDLASKLAKVKLAMPDKKSPGGVRGVLIKNGRAIASNSEIRISAVLPDAPADEKPFILTSQAIEMIESLPDGEIEIVETGLSIYINSGTIKNKYTKLDSNDIYDPEVPPNADCNVKINSQKLAALVSSVMYAASVDATRPLYTGVLLEAKDGRLNAVALDGFRAAWNKTEYDGDFKLIIPRASIEKFLKLKIEGDIEISACQNSALFSAAEYAVYTRLLAGEFMDYKTALPTHENRIDVDRKTLLDCMARVKLCSDGTATMPVVFTLDDGVLTISIRTAIADYSEEISVDGDADLKLKIGFNSRYLTEALKSIEGETATIAFGTGTQPIVLENGNMRCMILPVRLKE